jgi:RHS repeat-associated protein
MSGQTLTDAYLPMPGGQSSMYENSGGHHFEHHDWRGSVVLRTSIGNRTNDFDRAYAPFGEAYDSFGASGGLNFTGDTQDIWAGLFDTPNRELAPKQGRWLSPDPAGAGWNRYSYASNNPLGLVDPSGLIPDNPHWENFDARVYLFDSSFDASLNPGDAFIQAAIQGFQVQAGLNSPIQQGAAVYQSCVALNFNCDANGNPSNPNYLAQANGQYNRLSGNLANVFGPGVTADSTNCDLIGGHCNFLLSCDSSQTVCPSAGRYDDGIHIEDMNGALWVHDDTVSPWTGTGQASFGTVFGALFTGNFWEHGFVDLIGGTFFVGAFAQ